MHDDHETRSGDEWRDDRKLVLAELSRLAKWTSALDTKVEAILVRLAIVELKAATVGAIVGAAVVAILEAILRKV